jgi:hypothetical protein
MRGGSSAPFPKRRAVSTTGLLFPIARINLEYRENGQRHRDPVGVTAAQAIEAQRKWRHDLEGRRWNPKPTPEARAHAALDVP